MAHIIALDQALPLLVRFTHCLEYQRHDGDVVCPVRTAGMVMLPTATPSSPTCPSILVAIYEA